MRDAGERLQAEAGAGDALHDCIRNGSLALHHALLVVAQYNWTPPRAQAFTEEQRAELHVVEAQIKRRVAIGSAVSERKLREELVRCGMADMLVGRALHYLTQQGDLEQVRGRRMIQRLR